MEHTLCYKKTEMDHRSSPYITVCGEGSDVDGGVYISPNMSPEPGTG